MEQIRARAIPAFQKRLREKLPELLATRCWIRSAWRRKPRCWPTAATSAKRSRACRPIPRQLDEILNSGGEVGKRLDFLLQEMNRETNTILSKTSGIGDLGLRITELALAAKVRHRKDPRAGSESRMTTVFIISAPSGSGKSTLVHRLLATVPSCSSPSPIPPARPAATETDGVDYNFISRKDFEARLARGEFLEYAEVFGNYYGTNRETFEAAASRAKTWYSTSTSRVRDN